MHETFKVVSMALMIWKVLSLCCQKISFDRLAGESITCIYKGWSNELGELEADEVRESFSLKLLGFVHSLEWLLWFSTKWKGIFFSVPGKRFLWLLLFFFSWNCSKYRFGQLLCMLYSSLFEFGSQLYVLW